MSKPIDAVVAAPVVSEDSSSPEQQMASQAKQIQIQTERDSQYDTKLERFVGCSTSSQPLLAVGVVLCLFAASVFMNSKRRF